MLIISNYLESVICNAGEIECEVEVCDYGNEHKRKINVSFKSAAVWE